jgi:hypothetical protein
MNFKKIIGFRLDTNQFTSKTIESESEAILFVEKVIKLYGKEVINYMFLTYDKRYTTFKKDGISLVSVLNCV